MIIKKIEISNFKSFKKCETELGDFNVLIGANSSGKSNFIQIFKFLRDITDYGLENAVSMQGGIKYLRNMKIGPAEDLSLRIIADTDFKTTREKDKKLIGIKFYEYDYEFSMGFYKRKLGYKICKDNFTQKGEFVQLKGKGEKGEVEEVKNFGKGEVTIAKTDKWRVKLFPSKGLGIEKHELVPPYFLRDMMQTKKTLLEFPSFFFTSSFWKNINDLSIYDFDPRLPKKAAPITGLMELEEDGSNLALIIKNIIENREKKRKFENLIKDLLPFVSDLDTEKFADRSLLLKLRETYYKKEYLPASLISEGTLNIVALIISLFFEMKGLTIIEEPERNIHPYLISKVVDLMKDASNKRQIIITTHNPEIVKYAGLENLLLIRRDEAGFSTICKPAATKELQSFLGDDLGLDDLYVQNLLEICTNE
jgi:predicted ATPase